MTSDKKNPTQPQEEPRKDERNDRSNEGQFEREDSNRDDKPGVQKLGKAH